MSSQKIGTAHGFLSLSLYDANFYTASVAASDRYAVLG